MRRKFVRFLNRYLGTAAVILVYVFAKLRKYTFSLIPSGEARKINYIQGKATFQSSNSLSIEKIEGGTEELTFENAILATGSVPTIIPSGPLIA